jgi:DNA repair ATPase RecN
MDQNLQKLIELARKHKITPEEHQAQVRSFTYGNTHLENSSITREDVDTAVKNLNSQPTRYAHQ